MRKVHLSIISITHWLLGFFVSVWGRFQDAISIGYSGFQLAPVWPLRNSLILGLRERVFAIERPWNLDRKKLKLRVGRDLPIFGPVIYAKSRWKHMQEVVNAPIIGHTLEEALGLSPKWLEVGPGAGMYWEDFMKALEENPSLYLIVDTWGLTKIDDDSGFGPVCDRARWKEQLKTLPKNRVVGIHLQTRLLGELISFMEGESCDLRDRLSALLRGTDCPVVVEINPLFWLKLRLRGYRRKVVLQKIFVQIQQTS